MNKRKAFFNKLKKEKYTILLPNMLPIHFRFLSKTFNLAGYKTELLETEGRQIKDEGLKNIHNDACYPALIVTGQYIDALNSGKYDLNKTAVLITQTGGGCRASNYYFLIKKALEKQFPQVPVITLNVSGLEKDFSIPIGFKMAKNMLCSVLYGDLIMLLYNQTKPYETYKNQADEIQEKCFDNLLTKMDKGKGFLRLKKNYQYIINEFSLIKIPQKRKPRVGIVGEIFVKYSSLANNHLVDFLVSEQTEVELPSLTEFLLYCLSNNNVDYKLYKHHKFTHMFVSLAYKFLYKMSINLNKSLKGSQFYPYEDFENVKKACQGIISRGVKMGEGWLIPAEMVAMAKRGVKNIVCAQPFGCLPNHIVGKGMIRPIKNMFPDVNIAAIDYDPGATKVNQENRIKLMLANIEQ